VSSFVIGDAVCASSKWIIDFSTTGQKTLKLLSDNTPLPFQRYFYYG
jgi:hypothetical protein